MIAPGGSWINVGPLMYHWADPFSELAIAADEGPSGGGGGGGGGLDERYHMSLELSWEVR